jgi:hypothetical protein
MRSKCDIRIRRTGSAWLMPELSLDVLDDDTRGNGVALGGMVIREEATPGLWTRWGKLKTHYR